MATTGTPTWDFDVTKFMADFKLPRFDVEAMIAAQRKTIEAMAAANRTALEGAQAVARRQAEIMRQSAADWQSLWSVPLAATNGEADPAGQQAAAMKAIFEKTVANIRELSELVAKSNGEAAEIVTKRVSESFDEIRTIVSKH